MPSSPRIRQLLALGLGIALLVALVLLRKPAADAVLSVAAWVDGLGWIAPAAYVSACLVGLPLFVPAAPLLLVAGILFGPLLGSLYGTLGVVLGGGACFALARHVMRSWIEGKLGSVTGFAVVREALRREGLRGAALIRFTPAPAWLINYALGLSPLGWRAYLLSSVGVVPTVALYTLAGAGLGDLAALERGEGPDRGGGYYALLGSGIAATLAALALLGRRAKRILEEMNDA